MGTYTKHDAAAALYSVIYFKTDQGRYIEFIGPQHLIYPIGKEFTIFYDRKKPEKFLMFNFAGLVLSPKMIIPGVILIIWLAFYLSFITRQK